MYTRKRVLFLLAVCISCFASTVPAANDLGPTVIFDYDGNTEVLNPLSDFMYFVPSISLVPVDSISSYDNDQMIRIVSYKKKTKSKSFKTVVKFQIEGNGHHINTYDPASMISENLPYIKKGQALENMLEYIKIDGRGSCSITTKGRIERGNEVVEQVDIKFDTKKQKSPLTVSLYTVRPVDGKYEYQDCCDKMVARIKSMSFKRTDGQATMNIEIDSILDENEKGNIFSGILGGMANLITRPIRIDNDGNNTMLDFGFALHQNQDTFTFPKAKNLTSENIRTSQQYSKNTN